MSITTLSAEGEPRTCVLRTLRTTPTDLQEVNDNERSDHASHAAVLTRNEGVLGAQEEASEPRANKDPLLVAERNHRFHFLEASAVDYLEVDGNYVTIHVGEDRFLLRATLKQLAAQLAGSDFVRVDRSCVVNLRRVEYVERLEGGQFAFTLRQGHRIVSSRERAGEILKLLRTPVR